MVLDHRISRRQLLKSGAAGAAAATLATLGPTVALGAGKAKLIPEDKVGTITFTQRDVPGRLGIAASAAAGVAPTMGNLGGANIFTDPNDVGPTVPLPGGWKELFEFLASVGITQVEFAGYGQNANNPGGAGHPVTTGRNNPAVARTTSPTAGRLRGSSTIRSGGDRQPRVHPGHVAGPRRAGGAMPRSGRAALHDRARVRVDPQNTLHGHRKRPDEREHPNDRRLGSRRREVGGPQRVEHQLVRHPALPAQPCRGLPLHPGRSARDDHAGSCDRGSDHPTQVPAESGQRLMEYYLQITDPDLCVIEMDIYWARVAQHRFRWRYDETGARVEDIFNPLATVQAQTKRFALYHAKDGDRRWIRPASETGTTSCPSATRRATSTSRPSSPTRARRASTTRTTSRTTHQGAAAIPAARSGSPSSAPSTWSTSAADRLIA